MDKVRAGKITLGAVLIIIGIAFLLERAGISPKAVEVVLEFWPAFLILLGAEFLLLSRKPDAKVRLNWFAMVMIVAVLGLTGASRYGTTVWGMGWSWGDWIGWTGPLAEYSFEVPISEAGQGISAVKLSGVGETLVTGADQNNVTGTVKILVRAVSHEDARDLAESMRPDVGRSGGTLTIDIPRSFNPLRRVTVNVESDIVLPHDLDLELSGVAGNITVMGMREGVDIRSAAGSVTVDAAPERVKIRATAGNCNAKVGPGTRSFNSSMSAGNLDLAILDGSSVNLEASAAAGNVSTRLSWIDVTKRAASSSAKGTLGTGECEVKLDVTAGNIYVH